MKYVYELRDEAPAIRHIIHPDDGDATFCEEYVGDPLEDGYVNEHKYVVQQCPVCNVVAHNYTMGQARSFVARELGVDESEVF